MEFMTKSELKEAVEDFSFGVISTAINLTLSLAVFGTITMTSGRSPAAVSRASELAANITGVNKEILKRAFWKSRNLGLLRRKRTRGKEHWIATQQGLKRLAAQIPTYQTERPWDGKIYLVTYDVPREKSRSRDKLREQLVRIGARRFQHSVYLILWDPTDVIKKFISEHDLSGLVIVSDTGTDGSIGEIDLDHLIWETFALEDLNQSYEAFIQQTKKKNRNPLQLGFHYLSILADDPQLPFELLGPTWKGDKAYRVFKKLFQNQTESLL